MKALPASLIVEKNRLYSDLPWVVLLEVQVDDSSWERWAVYPESVTFAGQEYSPLPAIFDTLSESSEAKIEGVQVQVANANREVSAYLENNNIIGNKVVLKIVSTSELSDANSCLSFTYRINRVQVTDQAAVFELGGEQLYVLQLPKQRFIRTRCRWRYKDENCGYPGDKFGKTTQQTLHYGDGEKLNGWYVLNSGNIESADISVTYEGKLQLTNKDDAAYMWHGTTATGFFVYKALSGDTAIDTYFCHESIEQSGLGAGIMIRSSTDGNDWVALLWYNDGGTDELLWKNTVDGSTTEGTATFQRYGRIAIEGDTVTIASKSSGGDSWSTIQTLTRSDLSGEKQIGFISHATSAIPSTSLRFDYANIEGGLDSCDYTLDGPNGCRAHKNTLNFGGFPAIPYGRLYGI